MKNIDSILTKSFQEGWYVIFFPSDDARTLVWNPTNDYLALVATTSIKDGIYPWKDLSDDYD